MKIYLYYSGKNITQINDFDYLRDSISKAGKAIFNRCESGNNITVSITRASFSKDIDIYLVVDMRADSNSLDNLEKLKEEVLKAVRRDQNSVRHYMIMGRVDANHKCLTAESNTSNGNEVIEGKHLQDMSDNESEFDYKKRAEMYVPVEAVYTFDRVILPKEVVSKIEESLNIVKYEDKVFREWGLYAIQPNPSSALSFYGPSGTGKTMAAEAIASNLKKKILKVSYADIESKFHGEGPKMVKAIFWAAQNKDAVLFIDEADSLLSKRLTNVTQGSEQAINSMRSQLLICLEEFKGIVIFATNLVVNYDRAFLTRLISIEFSKPDKECRKRIWDVHIYPTNGNNLRIPLADDVNTEELADMFEFCGREIRKATISACVNVAMRSGAFVCQKDFISAAKQVQEEEDELANVKENTVSVKKLNKEQEDALNNVIKEKRANS